MRLRFSPPSRLGAQVWLHVCDVITSLIIMQTIHTSFAWILFFLSSWKKAKCEKYVWNVLLKVWNFKRKTKSGYIMSRILPRKCQGACLWLVSLNNNQTRAPSREGGENRGRIETLTAGDWAYPLMWCQILESWFCSCRNPHPLQNVTGNAKGMECQSQMFSRKSDTWVWWMFGTTPSPTIKKKPLNEKINNKIAIKTQLMASILLLLFKSAPPIS